MSDMSPAQSFLASIGSFIDDSGRREAIYKHKTLEGRPGDPHAPGDPSGYWSAKRRGSPHHEVGGHVGKLPSQHPHGTRGLVHGGSVQTLMILLRKAAQLFTDNSISDWNDMLEWDDSQVWREGARVFGSEENVRELIDSLPQREEGVNVNVDDVPDKLVGRFYTGRKSETSKEPKGVTPPKKAESPEPKKVEPPKADEVPEPAKAPDNRRFKISNTAVGDFVRAMETIDDPKLAKENWTLVLEQLGLKGLSPADLLNFLDMPYADKIDVLQELMLGLSTADLDRIAATANKA